jgi:hypothetical protein
MDFDNLQSVSSVSDTLPYEAISITGRDCFWDGSVPNSLVFVGSPTMSVSSKMPEPSGAGARVGGLADQVPSRPKVCIATLSIVTHTFSKPVNTTGSFSTAPGSAMGLNLSGSRPPFFHMGTAYRVLPYLLCRLGLVHHGMYPLSLILALRVLTLCLLASASSFQSGYHKDSGYL